MDTTSRRRPPLDSQSRRVPDLEAVEHLLEQFGRLEAELEQVRQGLVHSHRLATLGTIASVIAHESNNILTPMTSYCQLALAQPKNAELAQTAIQKSLEAAERLSRISSSLLGFSCERSRDDQAPLRRTIDEAVLCMGREPAKDQIELNVDVPDVVLAIPSLNLQQILLNLLLNARKAMARTGGRLEISGKALDGWFELRVTDSGCGIPPEIADRLFEPFVTRGLDPADAHGTGTGLGLSICRDLLEQAGGSIAAGAAEGSGTTFLLHIPIQNATQSNT